MKDIPGYEGLYKVTEDGKVWSCRSGRYLADRRRGKGYRSVVLCKGGDERTFSVHRIVAEVYIEKTDGKNQVNHIDGDKLNNSVGNLEWCTNSENVKHAYAKGIRSKVTGADHQNAKGGKLRMPCGDILVFRCQQDLVREFGLDRTCVSDVLSGKRKSHKGWTKVCT